MFTFACEFMEYDIFEVEILLLEWLKPHQGTDLDDKNWRRFPTAPLRLEPIHSNTRGETFFGAPKNKWVFFTRRSSAFSPHDKRCLFSLLRTHLRIHTGAFGLW
jgi:hypothetical protein